MSKSPIRRLGPSDLAAYRALRLRALREHPDAFTSSAEEEERRPDEDWARRLSSENPKFWGAFRGEQLCAMVGLEREARAKNRHKATVIGMYVAPEHAGAGLARGLLDALLAQAKREGVELLVLTVTDGNARATQLYERFGFRSFGIEPKAIRVAGRDHGKNHMFLDLASAQP